MVDTWLRLFFSSVAIGYLTLIEACNWQQGSGPSALFKWLASSWHAAGRCQASISRHLYSSVQRFLLLLARIWDCLVTILATDCLACSVFGCWLLIVALVSCLSRKKRQRCMVKGPRLVSVPRPPVACSNTAWSVIFPTGVVPKINVFSLGSSHRFHQTRIRHWLNRMQWTLDGLGASINSNTAFDGNQFKYILIISGCPYWWSPWYEIMNVYASLSRLLHWKPDATSFVFMRSAL